MADQFAPKPFTRLLVGDCREVLPRLQTDHHRGPLKFPRSLGDIIRDMERSSSPRQYDELLDEYESHPEAIAQQAEYDAADAVVEEQDRRGTPPLRLAN